VLTTLASRGTGAKRRDSSASPDVAALDFYGLLRALREREVEFVLIGCFALGFHGAPRGTKDVDIVPDPSPANIARLWEALRALDAEPAEQADFRPDELPVPFSMEGLLGGGDSALETRLGRLDVMQRLVGVDSYDELQARAVVDEPPEIGRPIWIVGRDDLVTMKQEAGPRAALSSSTTAAFGLNCLA